MDMTREYLNGAFIPGSETLPALWTAKAAKFRENLGTRARLDLPYGPAPRNRFDLFLPDAKPKGLLVFIHGGYWLSTDKSLWSHLAAGVIAQGWACALPGYTLAPQARIAQITHEIDQAITTACTEITGPLVITGHSAGGHLAARMGNPDRSAALRARLNRIVPISPLAELEPLSQTDMQSNLHLDASEIAAESPARHPLQTQAHIWVGSAERPAFLWQARTLSENWNCPWTVDPGTHHYNVIDGLEDPKSPLMRTCLGGL